MVKDWKKVDDILLKHIKKIDDELVAFPNFIKGEGIVNMTKEDFYFQYLSHTIYHRGQLMTTLKKLDKEGTTTDYLLYLFDLDGS